MKERSITVSEERYEKLIETEKKYNNAIEEFKAIIDGKNNVVCVSESEYDSFAHLTTKYIQVYCADFDTYISEVKKDNDKLSNQLKEAAHDARTLRRFLNEERKIGAELKETINTLREQLNRPWYRLILDSIKRNRNE